MKCRICGKKVKVRLSQTDIVVQGRTVPVINIPAFFCPSCGHEFFHEIVLQKAAAYAMESSAQPLDYSAYEEQESDDMLANGIL